MNRKRKIVIVTAIGIVALGVTTGWSVLAGAAWPPQPYQASSPAGSWTKIDGSGNICIWTISPEDPVSGTTSGMVVEVTMDPTLGGAMPEATSLSPGFFTALRTGPTTFGVREVCYVKKDGIPKPTILSILVLEYVLTFTAVDAMDYDSTISIYSPGADKDADGLPDADAKPLMVVPGVKGHLKRI
jgi:hypothetical protein